MYKLSKLSNGMPLITIDLPHLNSVTSMVAVGVGSRYESRKNNGISHFLEHMFFKGSKKYKTAEEISKIVDEMGAVNNAGTDKEVTFYYIKSAAKHIEKAVDILSSMIKEPLFLDEEVEREKGVIYEEMRMYEDESRRHVIDLYENLQFGDQPLGWEIIGTKEAIKNIKRKDLLNYVSDYYQPENMALIFVGKIPKNINEVASNYFSDLKNKSFKKMSPYKKTKQAKPKINIQYKKTEQGHLILGVEGFDRNSKKRFASQVLSIILGEGMSSRLFIQVRERRGLAYSVYANNTEYKDTGALAFYAGLRLEKIEEGLQVIKDELEKIAKEGVTEEELKKAKEMERGHIALRSESTNFLATHFGTEYVIDRKIETFDEYLKSIDQVTVEDVQNVAKELFRKENYNLQIIAPIKSTKKFEEILNN